MKSPEGLCFDIEAAYLSQEERDRFFCEIVEVRGDDVIVLFDGKRVLVHASDIEKVPIH